ncbi:MAG: hypothetical protein ACMXYD_00845 [Candidatus Woesearchaeota archaeon]
MNKKAYIFSIVTFVVVAVIGVTLLTYSSSSSSSQAHEHILSADRFIQQFEQDFPRALQITAYRSLLGLEEHVTNTGEYLDDVNIAFLEIITIGSINNISYEVMDDATLGVFELRMQEIASQIGLDFSLSIQNVSIKHVDAFTVEVASTTRTFVQTRDEQTSWNYTTTLTSEFSIEQLRDPLYAVQTQGRVPNVITRSNVTKPYITADNDTTNLQLLYNNSYYVPHQQAPSFLMRFSNNLSASEYGIASLVNINNLNTQDVPVFTDRSLVDYRYFAGVPTSTNTIINMPSEFVLDNDNLAVYDAEGKTT